MPDGGKVHVDILPDLKRFGPQLRARLEQSVQDSLSVDINPKVSRSSSKAGRDAGGEFARAFKTRLERAMQSLPEGKVGLDMKPAQQRLTMFKRELRDLSSRRIGVDLDTTTASMLIGELESELKALERDRDVDIRVDAKAARAQLAAISADIAKLDGRTAATRVKQQADQRPFTDASPAMQAAVWTAGPAAIPAIGAGAGAAGGALSGLGAATAGLGVFAAAAVPAVLDVANAIDLQAQAAEGGKKEAAAYKEALKGLSPTAEDLVTSWTDLTDAYKIWQQGLQSSTLPVLSRGLDQVAMVLPSLSPIVRSAATGFNELLDSSEKALASPHWVAFTEFAARQAGPSIGILGRSVGNLAMGFTGLMVSFEPLWNVMGPGLEDLTAKFAAWANEGSNFTRFIAWTITNGPIFLSTFGSIAAAAVDVGTALGPLGTVYAQGLGLLAEAISWIAREAPWLLQVAVAAKTASVAFGLLGRANVALIQPMRELPGHVQNAQTQLQSMGGVTGAASGAVTRMRGALTGVVGVLGGPWGAALAGAMVLGGLWIAQKQKMAAAEKSWESALVASNGAIDENVRSTSAQNLADSGALEQAKAAGVSQRLVVNGLHEEGAVRRALLAVKQNEGAVDQALLSGTAQTAEARKALNAATQTLYGTEMQWADLSAKQKENLVALSQSFADLQPKFSSAQESQKLIAEATGGAAGAQQGQNAAMAGGTTQAMGLKAALDAMTSTNLSAAQAELSYNQAVTSATESIKNNGAATDLNTAAGQANRSSLLQLATAGNSHLVAMNEQKAGTAALTKASEDQRKKFIEVARQMGYTKSEAKKLANEYLGFPKKIKTAMEVDAQGRWGIVQSTAPGGHGNQVQAYATGGPVFGAGTATSDSIPALLSDGEFVQPTATVQHYGPGFMEALRTRQIPKDQLPGFAKGGWARTTRGTGAGPPEQVDDHRRDVKRQYDAMIAQLHREMGEKMARDFKNSTKGPLGVAKLAEASVGNFPEAPPGSNTNAITKWFGMSGAPWCAMFISWLFAKAGASKALGGASRTAWTGDYYGSGMGRVSAGASQPGDVAVYGTEHVNLITQAGGGRRVGGNQTPGNVTAGGARGGATIFRPKWGIPGLAKGGLVDVLRQDRSEDERNLGAVPRYFRELAGLAKGGVANGWTVVGEEGPELARFDSPARVYSNAESARVLAAAQRTTAASARGGDGAAAPMIGEVNNVFHNSDATVRQAMAPLVHSLNTLDRGGRYT